MQTIGEGITLTDSPHPQLVGIRFFRRYPENLGNSRISTLSFAKICANDERSQKLWHVTQDQPGN